MLRLAALGAAAAGAVAIAARDSGQAQFRSTTHLVEVYATVRTGDGVFARDLTKDDFELFDNGRRQEISVFSSEVQPSTIALVLDRSGSVAGQSARVTSAAQLFLSKLLAGDRASLGTLTWECHQLTSDKAALYAALAGALPTDMGSPVWGGTNRAMSSLAHESGRRAVVLLSDGANTPGAAYPISNPNDPLRLLARDSNCRVASDTSLATLDDIVHRAEREGTLIYTVSIDNTDGSSRDGDLRRVARESGGERYRLRDYDELADAFERVADELHHQYRLGFVPATLDGKRHTLEVRVKRPGVSVRARKNYVAAAAAAGAASHAAPVAPVTDAEVEWAIMQGVSGRKLEAACTAAGPFAAPEEQSALVQITIEGPLGRVMRAAREAKAAGRSFAPSNVTAAMREMAVDVIADLRQAQAPAPAEALAAPTVGPPPTAIGQLPSAPGKPGTAVGPRPIMATRIRMRDTVSTTIDPRPLQRPQPGEKLIDRYDLAAFKALSDVEVVAHSTAGVRSCVISERDKAAIR